MGWVIINKYGNFYKQFWDICRKTETKFAQKLLKRGFIESYPRESSHNPHFSWCLFVISATCPHRPIGGLLEPWYQVISERIALVYCLRHCRQHCSQTNRELSTEKPMYSILESSHLVCRLERGFFPANQWSKDFLIHGYMIVSLINGFDRHHICAYYHCTMR